MDRGSGQARELGPCDWHADTCDRASGPMARRGATVLTRLPRLGHETVLDLEAVSFPDGETWLNDEPTPIDPGEPRLGDRRTVIPGARLERMPATTAVPSRRPWPPTCRARRSTTSGSASSPRAG